VIQLTSRCGHGSAANIELSRILSLHLKAGGRVKAEICVILAWQGRDPSAFGGL
jgi:hypothetical protein